MTVIETERLRLRYVTADDAAFILELINEPGWINNIGDRGIRTTEQAAEYIARAFTASYENNGFGFYAIELKDYGDVVGICGLIKRDSLPDVDIGYALLARAYGHGYASEAAAATLKYARETLNIPRIVAITNPDNAASARVLETIGLKFEKMVSLTGIDNEQRLFS